MHKQQKNEGLLHGCRRSLLKTGWRKHLQKISHKKVSVSGDFNIDLLNPNKLKMADEFIDTMYCMSLHS